MIRATTNPARVRLDRNAGEEPGWRLLGSLLLRFAGPGFVAPDGLALARPSPPRYPWGRLHLGTPKPLGQIVHVGSRTRTVPQRGRHTVREGAQQVTFRRLRATRTCHREEIRLGQS